MYVDQMFAQKRDNSQKLKLSLPLQNVKKESKHITQIYANALSEHSPNISNNNKYKIIILKQS